MHFFMGMPGQVFCRGRVVSVGMSHRTGCISALRAVLLCAIIFLSPLAPIADWAEVDSDAISTPIEPLSDSQSDFSVGFVNGSGSQFLSGTQVINGTTYDINGQKTLDNYILETILEGDYDFSDVSMTLDRMGQVHICYRDASAGKLFTAIFNESGQVGSSREISYASSSGIDCSISVNQMNEQHIAWVDLANQDLYISRHADAGFIDNVEAYHSRIVMDENPVDGVRLLLDEDDMEQILWRHKSTNNLWMTNFTGTYWTTWKVLDAAIGPDFSVVQDDMGVIRVAYQDLATSEIRLLRITSMDDIEQLVLDKSGTVGEKIAMKLDPLGNEQLFYSVDSTNNSARLLRNLAGQSTGRIDTNPVWIMPTLPQGSESLKVISDADFNGDGLSDIVWADSQVSNETMAHKGLVQYYLGDSSGLSQTPSGIYNGQMALEFFGNDIAVCDVNGDGFDDLAVGRPGAGSNNTGAVNVYYGGSNGLSTNKDWDLSGFGLENQTGWGVACAGDVDSDLFEDLLIVSRNSSKDTYLGRVDLFLGSATGLGNSTNWTRNGSLTAAYFGSTVLGEGDLNGDGYDDFAISSTGNLTHSSTFSKVQIWWGGPSGPAAAADENKASNKQGRLFGHSMAWSDVNGDGFDDLAIGEPYNESVTYQAGKVWLYYGTLNGLTPSEAWSYESTTPSGLVGLELAGAGDVDENGYEDLLITFAGINAKGGKLYLFSGSAAGLPSEGQLIASGDMGSHSGWKLATGGDLDGDGMSEIVYSTRDVTNSTVWNSSLAFLTEQDWQALDFTFGNESSGSMIHGLGLGVGVSSESLVSINIGNSDGSYTTLLSRYDDDGSPMGRWVTSQSCFTSSTPLVSAMVVDQGGRAWSLCGAAAGPGTESLAIHRPDLSWVHMSAVLATSGSIGLYPDSKINSNGQSLIAFADQGGPGIWLASETDTSWDLELIRGSLTINAPLQLSLVNGTMVSYRDISDSNIKIATKTSSWNEETIGMAFSENHILAEATSGDVGVLAVWNISNNSSFALAIQNGSTWDFNEIPASPALNASIDYSSDGEYFLAGYRNLSGEGELWGRNISGGNWTLVTSWNSTGSTGGGLTIEFEQYQNHTAVLIADDSNSGDLLYLKRLTNEQANQSNISAANYSIIFHNSSIPVSHAQAYPRLLPSFSDDVSTNSALAFMRTADGDISLISATPEMVPATLGIGATDGPIALTGDGHSGLRIALFDSVNSDLVIHRLIVDSDGDLVPNDYDEMANTSGQWVDSDMDGFGDNPDGPSFDSCIGTSGTSLYGIMGCPDYDNDGWPATMDDCTSNYGISVYDRKGCDDMDRDGWSDNGGSWSNGDYFVSNWKQSRDSDGDTRGDNHGPDCCDTTHPSTGWSESSEPDLFPNNFDQWKDSDVDGFGDNTSGYLGDVCLGQQGFSSEDRLGCIDSDGDGYSDPSDIGQITEWNETHGADKWPSDPTQWADTDGDGFGDNGSLNATNPDAFPDNPAAASDPDMDGYPDNWTAEYNGTNGGGLFLDACPGVWGDSFIDKVGCPDNDGDGFSNSGDVFPQENSQWADTDGDGFGDNPLGVLGDQCIEVAGVFNGTVGVGCPIINNNDDDLDGILNEYDGCPDTPSGETANSQGCSNSQLDDDLDDVNNAIDLCPNTLSGAVVDADGCSDIQRQTDSDDDGILDPEDDCPETINGSTIDSNGCASYQLDTDGDGVMDDVDQCSDTPLGAAIDLTGCIVAGYDGDNDGVDDIDDPFPIDPTQWEDSDGDGWGDNASGQNPDRCPNTNGSSYQDREGCLDTDGDGWSDPDQLGFGTWGVTSGADAFVTDSTQWVDSDRDGYGDNASGNNPDLCPNTDSGRLSLVNSNGCDPSSVDTDGDGVNDISDNCPDVFGNDPANTGCPKESTDGPDDSADKILGIDKNILFMATGGVVALVVILFLLAIMLGGKDDDWDDDDDDDDDDWDDDDDDVFAAIDSRKSSRSSSSQGPSSGPSRGPSSGPSSGPSGPSRGPSSGPSSGPSGPSRGPSGPSRGGPGSGPPPSSNGRGSSQPPTGRSQKVKKTSVPDSPPNDDNSAAPKVRKARAVQSADQPPWMKDEVPIFTATEENDKADAVRWAWEELQENGNERTILMQLQETGWTARQSRAIIDEANTY